MEYKDWMLLFIPIICNGILLTFWGKTLDRKIKKLSKLDEIEANTVADFSRKTNEARCFFNQLQKIYTNPPSSNDLEAQNAELQGVYNSISSCIQQLYDLSINYPFLNRFTDNVSQLQNHMNELVIFMNDGFKSVKECDRQKVYQRKIKAIFTDFDELYKVKKI